MFNKQGRRRKVVKSVSLDAAVARMIDERAAAENRTPSNFIETKLLEQMHAGKGTPYQSADSRPSISSGKGGSK